MDRTWGVKAIIWGQRPPFLSLGLFSYTKIIVSVLGLEMLGEIKITNIDPMLPMGPTLFSHMYMNSCVPIRNYSCDEHIQRGRNEHKEVEWAFICSTGIWCDFRNLWYCGLRVTSTYWAPMTGSSSWRQGDSQEWSDTAFPWLGPHSGLTVKPYQADSWDFVFGAKWPMVFPCREDCQTIGVSKGPESDTEWSLVEGCWVPGMASGGLVCKATSM